MTLRARVLALGVGAAAAVLVLLAIPVTLAVAGAERDQARADALSVAQGVADLVSTRSTETDLAAVVDRVNGRDGEAPVTVVLNDGSTLGTTQTQCASGVDRPERGRGGPGRGDGDGGLSPTSEATTVDVSGGQLVRIAASGDTGVVAVCALVEDSTIRTAVVERLAGLGIAGLVVLVAVGVAALLVARRLVRHLTVTARTADRLSEGDLDARDPEQGPTEVRRVGAALNRLAGRIDELLTLERETVADLSHRLRTPLTAVRLDVESLPDSPAKAELDDHLDQLERTLTAVIQAARRPQREGAAPHCDAGAIVRERFAYWEALFDDQARTATLAVADGVDGAQVRCAAEDLGVALDALLENVAAHTDEGTSVHVAAVRVPDGGVQVDVCDRGPGVPPDALVRGRSDRGSTGLGLDIARACAEATGGRLELGSLAGWSVVRLVLLTGI